MTSSSESTRRAVLTQLLSSFPLAGLAGVSGLGCSSEPSPPLPNNIPHPTLDQARLKDALSGAFQGSPWAAQVEGLVTDAVAELDALREAGLDSAADVAVYALDGIVSNLAGGFGEVLANRGKPDPEYTELGGAMINELGGAALAIRAQLPAATSELTEFLGGDSIPPDPQVGDAMAVMESELRARAHELGLSGQGAANSLIGRLQTARTNALTEGSAAASSAKLDGLLAGLATDADIAKRRASWEASANDERDLDTVCDVVGAIGLIVGFAGAIHSGYSSASSLMDDALEHFADLYQDYYRQRFNDWLASEITSELYLPITEALIAMIEEQVYDSAEDFSEEQCNALVSLFLIVVWMVGVVLALCSFMQSLSWAVAGIGAFATTGSLVLVCFLLLLLIVFFVIEILCSILQVAPALQALSEGCR